MKEKKSSVLQNKEQKPEKLYKDKGRCIRFTKSRRMIQKSKYQTPEDAKSTFDKLLALRVINPNLKLYKCSECKMWHYGSSEDIE